MAAAKELHYKIIPEKSQVFINGDSNLHKWQLVAKKISAQAIILTNAELMNEIKSIDLSINSESIESEYSSMTKKTHELLKANSYPLITFSSNEISLTEKNIKPKKYQGIGNLSVAGVTKTIKVNSTIDFAKEFITIEGFHKLLMSDFGMKPPRLLLLKTDDEVEVMFKLFLARGE